MRNSNIIENFFFHVGYLGAAFEYLVSGFVCRLEQNLKVLVQERALSISLLHREKCEILTKKLSAFRRTTAIRLEAIPKIENDIRR